MYRDKIRPTRTFCAQWYCCPGNTDSTEPLHSDDSLPPAIESRWSMNSCRKPPPLFRHSWSYYSPLFLFRFSSYCWSHVTLTIANTWPAHEHLLLPQAYKISPYPHRSPKICSTACHEGGDQFFAFQSVVRHIKKYQGGLNRITHTRIPVRWTRGTISTSSSSLQC